MNWYHAFLGCVILLWICAAKSDRNALRIVLVASIFSTFVINPMTLDIVAAEKLLIPATLEILTALALCKWSLNKSGILNIGCLGVAWLAHIQCYVDVWLKTDIVYSQYETIIKIVALGQLAACHDTFLHIIRGLYRWANSNRVGGLRRVQSACVRAPLLRTGDSPIP